MTLLRIQGLSFSLTALLLASLAASISRLDPRLELIVAASLICVLGVPHGALDTLFARQLLGIRTVGGWLAFAAVYLLLGALVAGVWYLQPALFLLGFLLISAAHFSGDPASGTPWPARLLYGGAIIVLPAILHAAEMTRLFALLVGPDAAALTVPWLEALAWPWLAAVVAAALHLAWADWLTALEISSAAALAVLAPPLIAFVLFFCGMHSARHILRTVRYSGHPASRLLVGTALLPLAGTAAIAAAAWHFLPGTPLDARLVQLLFVGLAALTVPHMALVERVRFTGWA